MDIINKHPQSRPIIWVILLSILFFLITIIVLASLGVYNESTAKPETKPVTGQDKKSSEISNKNYPDKLAGEAESPAASGLEVTSLKKNDTISSPLVIKGRARGTWYFEGNFPVKLMDGKGNFFAEGYATAQGEWMTENWVPFESTIKFSNPATPDGFVLFIRNNPSGMPANDYSVSIPVKFSEKSASIPSKCGHDPKDDPIMGDCAEDCNTANWKIYKNVKYGYSFRYPTGYIVSNNCKKSNCISEQDGGDTVSLFGDLSNQGWPMIDIRHLQNEPYNPPEGVNEMEWIKSKFSWTKKCFPESANIYFTRESGHMFGGFNIYFPASPQTYSQREIYYNYKNKIFQIVMLDVDLPQARQFYDIWLSTFNVVGEN